MSRNQVSGSLALDMSGVAEGVSEQLLPALQVIHNELAKLNRLVTSAAVDDQTMVHVLRQALIDSRGQDHPAFLAEAGYLAERLTAGGYVLVQAGTSTSGGPEIGPPTIVRPAEGEWLNLDQP